jgi:hypothetical protein
MSSQKHRCLHAFASGGFGRPFRSNEFIPSEFSLRVCSFIATWAQMWTRSGMSPRGISRSIRAELDGGAGELVPATLDETMNRLASRHDLCH